MGTFLELYGNAIDVELNSADRTVLFTTARRKHEVNEGQREFVRLTECLSRTSTIALSSVVSSVSSGVTVVNLSTSISTGDYLWLGIEGIEIRNTDSNSVVTYTAGDDLLRRDIPWLNRYDAGWRTGSAGTPEYWYLHEESGVQYLGLVPRVNVASSSDTWELLATYLAYPSSMTSDTQVPFAVGASYNLHLRPWHQGLVHYAAGKLERLRGNTEASDRQMALFTAYVQDYRNRQQPKGGQTVMLARNYRGERPPQQRYDPKVDW